jgi:zinc transporter
MVELPDTRGLICGFTLRPNAPPEALNWELTSDPSRTFEGAVWLHFSLGDVRAKKWISACERIPARAREILLDTDPHIRMEAVERGFAGVLGDLHYEFDDDPDRLGVMHLCVDERLVVTARLQALKVADQLRLQLRGGMVVPSTLRLVIQFLEDFSDTIATVVTGQADIVDEAEDRILKNRFLRDAWIT